MSVDAASSKEEYKSIKYIMEHIDEINLANLPKRFKYLIKKQSTYEKSYLTKLAKEAE